MKRVLAALFVLGLGCGEGAVPAVADPLLPVTLTAQQRLEAAPVTFRVMTTGSEGVFATRRVQYGPEHAPVHFSFSDGWLDAQAANGTLELTRFDATVPAIELKLGATPVVLSRAQVTLPEPATLRLEWFGDGDLGLARGDVSVDLHLWLRLSTGAESPLEVATLTLPIELVVSRQGEVLGLELEGSREGVLWSWAGLFEFADFKVIVRSRETAVDTLTGLIN